MTNILLLSVGTRNKVIQYFKKEFAGVGNVVVTDLTEIAPAIYEADKHYQVPRIIEDGYIDLILNICKKEQISGVLSLIDPELSLIAKIREVVRDWRDNHRLVLRPVRDGTGQDADVYMA